MEFKKLSVKLSEVQSIINCKLVGDDILLDGLNLSNRDIIADSVLSYAGTYQFFKIAARNPKVKALVINEATFSQIKEEERSRFSLLVCESPEWAFYEIFANLVKNHKFPEYDFETNLNGAIIGKGSIIEKGVIFGRNVKVGYNTVICSGTIIGDDVTIGNNCIIGGNGFQLIRDDKGVNRDIPHVGRLKIGNRVTIGDVVTIARSLFEDYTIIGDDVKTDNHVHIAHNCIVGNNCVLTANVTLFGSCELEENVWLAPSSSIMNKVKVGKNSFICASSLVITNVRPGWKMFGNPAHKIEN